ncbi:hypothetical protein FBEOM_8258 [Fusarium beomiforme]|uniref:NAD(P)-binding domain-containing protein n=1 Tax=Fusarium beomiforme TaxID=44412 RepID=A0A9P5AFS3_9HYPO|nr:hypothetical protein FBEOM_8258 [Fusarium beomiforme]
MHILLLSSSNHNSTRIIQSALSRNFTIAFLTPQPSYIPQHDDTTVITGLPASQHDLETALQTPRHPEAIILAFYNTHVLKAVTHALVRALKAIHLTNSSEAYDSAAMPLRLVFIQSNAIQLEAEGYKKVDEIVRESGLPFDLAHCPRLAGELSTAIQASPEEGRVAAWLATVKKARMAQLLVDTAEENNSNGKELSGVEDKNLS